MTEHKLNIGVLGYGYWGPNIVRNFTSCSDTHVVAVSDMDSSRREAAKRACPWVRTTEDAQSVLGDSDIDAVAVVTPMATHYPLAKAALEAGKHVLVEKPLATSKAHCVELTQLAKERGKVLHVDHTFVFTGAVRKMQELVTSGHLGRVLYFDSVRINLGLFQPDSNVLWDLAPHDLSILNFVLDREPKWVMAVGVRHYSKVEDLAYLTIGFDDDLLAHFHCNWLAPVKTRRTIVAGTERMLVYDDTEPSEKIKIYDSGVTFSQMDREAVHQVLVQYRTGDVLVPKLDGTEALRGVVSAFASSCLTGEPAVNDGSAGVRVVSVLEAAEESLRNGGKRVSL